MKVRREGRHTKDREQDLLGSGSSLPSIAARSGYSTAAADSTFRGEGRVSEGGREGGDEKL